MVKGDKPYSVTIPVVGLCQHHYDAVLRGATEDEVREKCEAFEGRREQVEGELCRECELSDAPFTKESANLFVQAARTRYVLDRITGVDIKATRDRVGDCIVVTVEATSERRFYHTACEYMPPLMKDGMPSLRVRPSEAEQDARRAEHTARQGPPRAQLPSLTEENWTKVCKVRRYPLRHTCGHSRVHCLRGNDSAVTVAVAMETASERLCPDCMRSNEMMTARTAAKFARTLRSIWPMGQADAYPLRGAKALYQHGVLFREARADIATVLISPIEWKALQHALELASKKGEPFRKRHPEFRPYHALLDDLLLHPERARIPVSLMRAVQAARMSSNTPISSKQKVGNDAAVGRVPVAIERRGG